MNRRQLLLGTLLLLFAFPTNLPADDFDDGISKSTDDAISADDELGKASKNIKFIIEKSKSQAKVAEKASGDGKSTTKTGKTTGDNNQNSVVMGSGSKVTGDIIIIGK